MTFRMHDFILLAHDVAFVYTSLPEGGQIVDCRYTQVICHPSFKSQSSINQFVVFETAANSSIVCNRARLSADIRLSIMYELARPVHFLPSGGCEGWNEFHGDTKRAKISLAGDFTRLIDCMHS